MARKQGSHSEITGPKIRKAALRLFAQKGFAAVSMRELATEVGVQAGALYNYTSDKQTLLFDLMRAHMEEVLSAWSAHPPEVAPLDQLDAFSRFHINFHFDRAHEIFVAYMELRNLTPQNFQALEALRRQYETELEVILNSGQKSGVFQVKDTRVTARAVIAMLTGINTWYRDGKTLSRPEIVEMYVDMVRGIAGARV